MKNIGLWLGIAVAAYVVFPIRALGVAVADRCGMDLALAAESNVHTETFGDRRHIEFVAFEKEANTRGVSMAVDVVDHGHLLDREPLIFDIAASQRAPLERIRFLIARVTARHEQLVISVKGNDTSSRYTPRPNLSETPIVIEYEGDWLPEHPDLALVGSTTKMFYKELLRFFEERCIAAVEEMNKRIEEIAKKITDANIPHDLATLHKKILDVLFLRTVWYAKEMLVSQIGPSKAWELRTGQDKDHPETDTKYLSVLRENTGGGGEDRLRESFTRFYKLDPRFVAAVWNERLPDGWDFPLANPPRIPLVP